MAEAIVKIPQIGEGLQEARIVAMLKQPGDIVKRDEPIYQMETDKAVMDVESPYAGRIVRWLANPDDVLPIGGDVAVMETDEVGEVAAEAVEAVPSEVPGYVSLFIPQIGEGLQEARIVAFLKQPGETVKRDEPIYQMETDKAVMDVESPYSGTLVEWIGQVDEVLPIGAEVGRLASDDAPQAAPSHGPAASTSSAPTAAPAAASAPVADRRRDVPPRTRAYAKEKGLSDDQLAQVSAAGNKLMPTDIDAFLAGGQQTKAPAASASGKKFNEKAMGGKQRVLASRLQRGNQLVVPGMMTVCCDWGPIETYRQMLKDEGSDFQPSTFTIFAYAVAKAAAAHPIMRSTLVGDSTIRTYENLQLGIAVSLPGDELVVAVVEDADALSWREFAQQAREKINLARGGQDQANESVTLSITNMQGYGIRDAMAVVVPPGVATIFLGEAHWGVSNEEGQAPRFQRCANVGITIDHRLINGVGGAEFLQAIKKNVEEITTLVSE